MKTVLLLQAFLGVFAAFWLPPASATSVPEPETILYGRVTTRVAAQTYQMFDGELKWSIRSPLDPGRIHTFKTTLEPLAGGKYSYKIRIPHQLLAFDLVVDPNVLPLTAGAQTLEHLLLTLDGAPAVILPSASPSTIVLQSSRARTHELNLEVLLSSLDSDGDGLPDWFEDRLRLDKWDPSDGGLFTQGQPPGTGNDPSAARTFAEWRQQLFPDVGGDLELFGREDFDSDGINNFLEYAYQMNPREADAELASNRFPRSKRFDKHFGLQYTRRTAATDLEYIVELSRDLIYWSVAQELEIAPLKEADRAPGRVAMRLKNLQGSEPVFMRVRVLRKE